MKVESIVIKNNINPRKKLSDDVIEHYSEILDKLPPVTVQQGTGVLIDGFHRVAAAEHTGKLHIPVEEIDIPDGNLFAEACRRNNLHGLPLTKDERNGAIVKLYKDGFKMEALGEMWGITHQQVSNIVGADERTKSLQPGCKTKQSLTPKHEQVIRKAPKELQDKVAEVVLTRKPKPKEPDKGPKNKRLTVAQTNTLVNEVSKDVGKGEVILDHLLENPQEDRIIGTDDNGDVEEASIKAVIADAKANPGVLAEWAGIMVSISEFKVKYTDLDYVASELMQDEHCVYKISQATEYFDSIVATMEVLQCKAK